MIKYLIFFLLVGYAGAQIIPPAGGWSPYTLTAAKIGAAGGITNGGSGASLKGITASQVGAVPSIPAGVSTQFIYYASATNCAGVWMDADNQYTFKIKAGVYSAITNAIP